MQLGMEVGKLQLGGEMWELSVSGRQVRPGRGVTISVEGMGLGVTGEREHNTLFLVTPLSRG